MFLLICWGHSNIYYETDMCCLIIYKRFLTVFFKQKKLYNCQWHNMCTIESGARRKAIWQQSNRLNDSSITEMACALQIMITVRSILTDMLWYFFNMILLHAFWLLHYLRLKNGNIFICSKSVLSLLNVIFATSFCLGKRNITIFFRK